MKCEEVESIIVDYIDNALEKEQKEAVEKHLETCERCQDELKEYQEILNTVDSEKMEMPDETLRINFYHMLHGEMKKLQMERNKPVTEISASLRQLPILKIAAGFALFIAGAVISGLIFGKYDSRNDTELTALKTEMQNMKEIVMLNMLKEESPSQRIQAVNYTDEFTEPDNKVLDALATTLNKDRNVNVRIAAAYSLARFSTRQEVRDTLVASLSKQTEPIIQVILMNILVEMKETRAVKPMQQIITDDKSLQEVKDVAQKGVSTLL
jgi:hypothetical protein